MGVSVGVMGASGYSGGELLRLIAGHPELTLVAAGAHEQVGARIRDLHPHLDADPELRFVANDSPHLLTADVVFAALPHGQSAAHGDELATVPTVVDLGADHRLIDAAMWRAYYGDEPWPGAWTYGLPELPGQRARIAASSRVANPGCYATAVQVALAPLVHAGVIDTDGIVVVAASGTSGAGRSASAQMMATQVIGSMSAYKVGGVHQHTPEMEQQLAALSPAPVKVSFTPLLAPMPRGIIAVCTADGKGDLSVNRARELLAAAYAAQRFVTVLEPGIWPATSSTVGSNRVLVQVAVDERTNRVTVVSALDNLGKGAAGQAVQNANIMLGFPEELGLATDGTAL